MEDCQKKYILSHLPKLIENTKCTELFLKKLVQKGALHHSSDIESIRESSNGQTQAGKLYEILMTRLHSFDTLLSALDETGQSGAFGILNAFFTYAPQTAHNNDELTYDQNLLLGTGSYATKVYQGKFGARRVAVKVINSECSPRDIASKEVDFLLKCDWHENIVRYFTVQTRDEFILIAVEKCDMALGAWVKSNKETARPELEVDILRQATRGLGHLHSLRIVHRDVKPDNILLLLLPNGWLRVKLTDFGLSRGLPSDKSDFTFRPASGFGTLDWASPEVLHHYSSRINHQQLNTMRMTAAMDIFSLGCVFYYVITGGKHPFGDDIIPRHYHMLRGNLLLAAVDVEQSHIPSILLIKSMIARIAKQRPTCQAVLSHPFFWTNETLLQFLSQAAVCSYEKDKHHVLKAVAALESTRDIILGPGDVSWIDTVEPVLQEHILSRPCYANNMCSLLQIVHYFSVNFESLSNQIRITLGNSSSESVSYWRIRFPLFIDMVWMSFREVMQEDQSLSKNWYSQNFNFDLENVDQLAGAYLLESVSIIHDHGSLHSRPPVPKPRKLSDNEMAENVHSLTQRFEEWAKSQNSENDSQSDHHQPSTSSDVSQLNKTAIYANVSNPNNPVKPKLARARSEPAKPKSYYQRKYSGNSPTTSRPRALDQINENQALVVLQPSEITSAAWSKYCSNIKELLAKDRSQIYKYHLKRYMSPLGYHHFIKALEESNLHSLLSTPDESGCLPLHYAIQTLELMPETLEKMKCAGVDINAVDNCQRSVLAYAIVGGRSVPVLETLIELGAALNSKIISAKTLIRVAQDCGNLAAQQYFATKQVSETTANPETMVDLNRDRYTTDELPSQRTNEVEQIATTKRKPKPLPRKIRRFLSLDTTSTPALKAKPDRELGKKTDQSQFVESSSEQVGASSSLKESFERNVRLGHPSPNPLCIRLGVKVFPDDVIQNRGKLSFSRNITMNNEACANNELKIGDNADESFENESLSASPVPEHSAIPFPSSRHLKVCLDQIPPATMDHSNQHCDASLDDDTQTYDSIAEKHSGVEEEVPRKEHFPNSSRSTSFRKIKKFFGRKVRSKSLPRSGLEK